VPALRRVRNGAFTARLGSRQPQVVGGGGRRAWTTARYKSTDCPFFASLRRLTASFLVDIVQQLGVAVRKRLVHKGSTPAISAPGRSLKWVVGVVAFTDFSNTNLQDHS
jgi:hypothetical protein